MSTKECKVLFRDTEEGDFEMDNETMDAILSIMEGNGYNVTRQAVIHNYCAWKCGFKSGYRDEENDYFLFTPCGGNNLSFTACRLISDKSSYKTYIA